LGLSLVWLTLRVSGLRPRVRRCVVIVGWIKETTALKSATHAMLGAKPNTPERMSEQQISMIVEGLGGLLGLLRDADPRDKAEIYSRLGLQLSYEPGTETLIAEVTSAAIDGVNNVCPRPNMNPFHIFRLSEDLLLP
jgi:hypothetical protein